MLILGLHFFQVKHLAEKYFWQFQMFGLTMNKWLVKIVLHQHIQPYLS